MGAYFIQLKTFSYPAILLSLVVGFLSVGVLNLNNMRDIVSDKLSNKITIAGSLGFDNAKTYHLLILIISLLYGLICFLYVLVFTSISLIVPSGATATISNGH